MTTDKKPPKKKGRPKNPNPVDWAVKWVRLAPELAAQIDAIAHARTLREGRIVTVSDVLRDAAEGYVRAWQMTQGK